jgi:hypothetical protein
MPVRLYADIDRTDVAVVVTVMMIFLMIFVKGVEGLWRHQKRLMDVERCLREVPWRGTLERCLDDRCFA